MVKKRGIFMKGFVCIAPGCYVNKDLIDKNKSYFDAKVDKWVIYDIYGTKYLVEKDLIKSKKYGK